MSGIDELRELHERLGDLIDDPQPGSEQWRTRMLCTVAAFEVKAIEVVRAPIPEKVWDTRTKGSGV